MNICHLCFLHIGLHGDCCVSHCEIPDVFLSHITSMFSYETVTILVMCMWTCRQHTVHCSRAGLVKIWICRLRNPTKKVQIRVNFFFLFDVFCSIYLRKRISPFHMDFQKKRFKFILCSVWVQHNGGLSDICNNRPIVANGKCSDTAVLVILPFVSQDDYFVKFHHSPKIWSAAKNPKPLLYVCEFCIAYLIQCV